MRFWIFSSAILIASVLDTNPHENSQVPLLLFMVFVVGLFGLLLDLYEITKK